MERSAESTPVSMTLGEILQRPEAQVLGDLTHVVTRSGISSHRGSQIEAWQAEIILLRDAALQVPQSHSWRLVMEFDIPRRGKRIDAVLLLPTMIVVLEFKVGSASYDIGALRQVEDYALELADFHEASHGQTILPVVVATDATESFYPVAAHGGVQKVARVAGRDLGTFLGRVASWPTEFCPVQADGWLGSRYCPTPTILEAANRLYSGHGVQAIARHDAEAANLTRTQDAILSAVSQAQRDRCKTVCFVTGVPGAGKTLAGLNAVHALANQEVPTSSVFLSGNGPLVKLLVESLAKDESERTSKRIETARRKAGSFVQNMHRFVHLYERTDLDRAPEARVVIFDEAQRAWDAKHSARKFKRPTSEPVSLFRILDRHQDWSVLVCLVGGGQEINSGEAGLREWGRALEETFTHWRVFVSPQLLSGDQSAVGQSLFDEAPSRVDVRVDDNLHLSVPMRSYRSTLAGQWVNAVLRFDVQQAQQCIQAMQHFPVALTRDLARARLWLHTQRKGLRRSGLVCTSGARRLRRYGIEPKLEFEVTDWFLNSPEDIRSSDFLEIAATEFSVQGLELDWVGVCWDADLRVSTHRPEWEHWQFRGDDWKQIRIAQTRQYLVNKYRVLLTRAREGMVIWIPRGDHEDQTRLPAFYDHTAEFLLRCGARSIDV